MHDRQWHELLGMGIESLPHALLLSGAPGLGKLQFAERLLTLLLCEQTTVESGLYKSCGVCAGCRWVISKTHPDVRYLSPDGEDSEEMDGLSSNSLVASTEMDVPEGGKAKPKRRGSAAIRIAAVRELEEFVFVGSHRQGRRIVLITNADAMNTIAANALLKILEEPPANVYFILITSNHDRLLKTLRSRCRLLGFVRPPHAEAVQFLVQNGMPPDAERLLSLAGGAPLQVVRWHETGKIESLNALLQTFRQPGDNPLILAGRWDDLLKKNDHLKMEFLVEAVQRWVSSAALGGASLTSNTLFAAWRSLLECRRSANHPLNQLLFLEEVASHALRAISGLAPAYKADS